jgi:hypothetical protein
MKKIIFFLLFGILFSHFPVIYINGLLDTPDSFYRIKQHITQRNSSTLVFAVASGGRFDTFNPILKQAEIITNEIEKLKNTFNFRRFHLICLSQGISLNL